MKRIRGFMISPVISAIVLVAIIVVGIYFSYALIAVQGKNEAMIYGSADNNIATQVSQTSQSE